MKATKANECSVDGCGRAPRGRGRFCSMHYQRWRRTGEAGPAEARWGTVNKGVTCAGPGCSGDAKAKGLCERHYRQQARGAELTPLKVRTHGMTLDEKVEHYTMAQSESGCILWGGPVDSGGYPTLANKAIHRYVYERDTGEALFSHTPVHHICGNRKCVEPSHLQAVRPHENTAEMLERKYYKARIAALESALRDLDRNHPLLEEVPID